SPGRALEIVRELLERIEPLGARVAALDVALAGGHEVVDGDVVGLVWAVEDELGVECPASPENVSRGGRGCDPLPAGTHALSLHRQSPPRAEGHCVQPRSAAATPPCNTRAPR